MTKSLTCHPSDLGAVLPFGHKEANLFHHQKQWWYIEIVVCIVDGLKTLTWFWKISLSFFFATYRISHLGTFTNIHFNPGINDQGLYRVVGVSSKVQKLLTLMIGKQNVLKPYFCFKNLFSEQVMLWMCCSNYFSVCVVDRGMGNPDVLGFFVFFV